MGQTASTMERIAGSFYAMVAAQRDGRKASLEVSWERMSEDSDQW